MIQYSCGCTFKTNQLVEAVNHAVLQNHVVTAHGLIRPEEHIVERKPWNGAPDK